MKRLRYVRKEFFLFAFLLLFICSLTTQIPGSYAQEFETDWVNRYNFITDNQDGSFTTNSYIAPQTFWNGETWDTLNFEDHYAIDGYYLIENSHITVRVYDWYSIFYDPDNQVICVDEESWLVQIYGKNKKWRDIDLFAPSLSYQINSTHLTVTRTFDNIEGYFEVNYILWQGSRLKHDVTFTSRIADEQRYQVIMKLTGIHHAKVKHLSGSETIVSETSIITPYFNMGEDNNNLVFSEYLWSLGELNEVTDIWTPTTLKDIVFDTHTSGSKCDIIIGDYYLLENESLLIDPDSSTFYVGGGMDDAHEEGDGDFYNDWASGYLNSYTDPVHNSYKCSGVRYRSVTIPQGVDITATTSCEIWVRGSWDDINCDIYAHDDDNADDFSTILYIISTAERPRTTATVSWVSLSCGDGWEVKAGLEDIIEEITDIVTWNSGNAIVLLFIAKTDVSKSMKWYTYEESSTYAGRLNITWVSGQEYFRDSTQAFSFASTVARIFETIQGVTQAFSLGSITTKLIEIGQDITQAISHAFATSRVLEAFKPATLAFSVGSITTYILEWIRSAFQTVDYASIIGRLIEVTRPVTLTLNYASTIGRLIEITLLASIALILGLIASKSFEVTRKVTQGISIDSLTATIYAIGRQVSQALNVGSLANRLIEVSKQVTQAISHAFATSRILEAIRSALQTINLAFQTIAVKSVGYLRSGSLSIVLSSIASSLIEVTRPVTQAIGGTFASSRILEALRPSTLSLQVASAVSTLRESLRSATQSFAVASITSTLLDFFRSITQNINFASSVIAYLGNIALPVLIITISSIATGLLEIGSWVNVGILGFILAIVAIILILSRRE